MRTNRLIWAFVSLVVLVTVAITFGAFEQEAQNKSQDPISQLPSKTPPSEIRDNRDLSKYGAIPYSAERENPSSQRFPINKRYDNQEWVYKVINYPETGGIGRITDDPPPPLYPIVESDLIVVGDVNSVEAFLSNDKGCVYSEFTIRIEEIFKNAGDKKTLQSQVKADREGGVVIYPNGQRVLYQSSDRGLPKPGSKYLFFLRNTGSGPNYEIISSFDITESKIVPMEAGRNEDEFRNLTKNKFLGTVRNNVTSKLN